MDLAKRLKLLFDGGKNKTQIAKIVKCPHSTVRYTINCYKKTESHENLKRSGRKRITSVREDRQLVRTSLKNRKKMSSELTADLFRSTEKKVSARTVKRRL